MKKVKCPLCPKKYQSENDLRKHLKRIHGFDKSKAEKELVIARLQTMPDNWRISIG